MNYLLYMVKKAVKFCEFHVNVLCQFKLFFTKKNYVYNDVNKWKNIPTIETYRV